MGFKRYGLLTCSSCSNGSAHNPLSGIVCSQQGLQSGRHFNCECSLCHGGIMNKLKKPASEILAPLKKPASEILAPLEKPASEVAEEFKELVTKKVVMKK